MACSASIGWGKRRPGARLGAVLVLAWAAGCPGQARTVESLVREAERLSLKYAAAGATVLLARAQFETGDAEGARRQRDRDGVPLANA